MQHGFQNTDSKQTVSLVDLRRAVLNRLEMAQRRLDPASMTAMFNRANDSGVDGLMGGLIFSLVTWVPFAASLDGLLDHGSVASDAFNIANGPVVAAAADGLTMIWDEKANKKRSLRRVDFKEGIYHGGRRQEASIGPKKRKVQPKFNLVAANENSRFAYDTNSEIVALNDMLNTLDQLAKDGVTLLSVDAKTPVSKSLRELSRKPSGFQALTRTATALRKAV